MLLGMILFFQVLVTPVSNSAVSIAQPNFAKTAAQCNVGGLFGIPTWYKYIKDFDDNCSPKVSFLSGGKFNGTVFTQILLAVVDILMRVGALIAVGFVLYGGFTYITSQGEPDGTKRGRTTIVNALVGLIIAIFASGIVAFIGGRLGS